MPPCLRASLPPPCSSLCIVDEFGKGTLAADGVGLLCATLRHWAGLPAPPRVVLCTHFRRGRCWAGPRCCWACRACPCGWRVHVPPSLPSASRHITPAQRPSPPDPTCSEVLSPLYLPRSPQLAFLTMSVVVQGAEEAAAQQAAAQQAGGQQGGGAGAAGEAAAAGRAPAAAVPAPAVPPGEEVVFLYRLVPGHAAPSFGVYCAQLAGVPAPTLARARQLIAAQVGARGVAGRRWGALRHSLRIHRSLLP